MIQQWMVVALMLGVCSIGACNDSADQPDRAETPAPPVETDRTPDAPLAAEEAVDEAPVEPADADVPAEEADEPPAVLQFPMTTLDGRAKPLVGYRGKVLLIVNTASRCAFTPQYAGLQALHEQMAEEGLAVLGFPANNFRNQEPGTDEQIAAFCQANFGVAFDMFSKISVAGEGRHRLYDLLTAADAPPAGAGPVNWNFEKFLIARDGTVVGHYRSKTTPADPALLEAIQRELNKQP